RLQGQVQLIVAGPKRPAFDLEKLLALARDAPYIKIVPQSLGPHDFADLMHASDCALLPYRDATTSGALMAALTFGRPVVASDLPAFSEITQLGRECSVLAPNDDDSALSAGIEAVLGWPRDRREQAARRLAERFSWPNVVQPVTEEMRRLITPR